MSRLTHNTCTSIWRSVFPGNHL